MPFEPSAPKLPNLNQLLAKTEAWTAGEAFRAALLSGQAYYDGHVDDDQLQQANERAAQAIGQDTLDQLAEWSVTTHASSADLFDLAQSQPAVTELLTQCLNRDVDNPALFGRLFRMVG